MITHDQQSKQRKGTVTALVLIVSIVLISQQWFISGGAEPVYSRAMGQDDRINTNFLKSASNFSMVSKGGQLLNRDTQAPAQQRVSAWSTQTY